MKKKGWIKLWRRELEWMDELSDRDFRYYVTSRLNVVWDGKSKHFGTFDARTDLVKDEFPLHWAVGKINQVKNSLLEKGFYAKQKHHRLAIRNAGLLLSKGRQAETYIQGSEVNLLKSEDYLQKSESTATTIRDGVRAISSKWRV